jgi:glycosyltransferase involved in cell wall biosynthesis
VQILIVHNEYGKVSGEEIAVRSLQKLLAERGHQISTYFRSSAEIADDGLGKAKAFFTGIYNFSSRQEMRRLLGERRPDIVHIHNLFPLISPSVLGECRRAGIPVVMTVHNYRLVCPNGLHMVKGAVCERCTRGREWNCVLNRCEGSLLKSTGYAIRNAVARKLKLFHRNVTLYAALTDFQKSKLVAAGFPADRISVLPNMVDQISTDASSEIGDWIGYVGRVSKEKGIETLLAAASMLPDVKFRIAGAYDRMSHLLDGTPPNVQFLGHMKSDELHKFYRGSRMIVLCSTCYEGFPTVITEASMHAKPVICSRIGGLPEIVDDGATGLLFTPGNQQELAERIQRLWSNPDLCREMGIAGRAKAIREYSSDRYYERVLSVYQRAIELTPAVLRQ